MKIGAAVAMAAVVVSGSMLDAWRGRGAPDFSSLPRGRRALPPRSHSPTSTSFQWTPSKF